MKQYVLTILLNTLRVHNRGARVIIHEK